MNFMQPNQGQFNPRSTIMSGPQIQWVQGIEGAKAFPLAPNSNVQLMDSENDGIFYIKTSDNIGMCNLRVFKYEEIKSQQSATHVNLEEYVRKDELEGLIKSIVGGDKDEQPLSTAKSSKNTSSK